MYPLDALGVFVKEENAYDPRLAIALPKLKYPVNPVQFIKALSPMLLTLSGIIKLPGNHAHPSNALSPILLTFSPIVIFPLKELQSQKA